MAQLRVCTPQGLGLVLETTPVSVQLARQRVGVLLDHWNGPLHYFDPTELEVWASTRYPLTEHFARHGLSARDVQHKQKEKQS